MKDYTVVLLRPVYLNLETDEKYGQDIYVALVSATSPEDSLRVAQKEVFKADKKDGMHPRNELDYKLCVMFEGHHQPKRFGWQF